MTTPNKQTHHNHRIAMVSIHGCPLVIPGMRFAGGMNVYLRDIAPIIAKKGVQVDIFTRNHHSGGPEVLDLGPGTRVIHLSAGDPELVKNEVVPYLPQFYEGLVDYIGHEGRRYDLVHSHYWLSGDVGQKLARQLQLPHVVSFHTLAVIKEREGSEPESDERKWIEHQMATQSDLVFAFTEDEVTNLGSLFGITKERVHVAPGGVDLSLFHPIDKAAARARLDIDQDENVVVFIGRPEPFKGPDVLIKAASEMPNREHLRIVLVGGSEAEHSFEWLRLLAAEAGIAGRISWFNAVPQNELVDFYAASDIVAVPSFHESFGLSALEAMACGRPVVASAVGALRTLIIEGETGCLVPSHAPADLARCLSDMLLNPELRKQMGQAGIQRARDFTWDRAADQALDGYLSLLDQPLANQSM
jgi:D-inositol-3-phosphate glycosyltransferase